MPWTERGSIQGPEGPEGPEGPAGADGGTTPHNTRHATGGVDPLAPADIGAAAASHTHAAGDVNSGTLGIARIPTGTTSTTVSLGDHTHDSRYYTETEVDTALSGKANSSHTHAAADVNSGTLDIARVPTGTTSTTVSLGNHNHSGVYANASHTHAAADVASGTLDIARVPTGTSGTTVALGNHTHTAPDTNTYETWNAAPRTQSVSGTTANIDVGAAGDIQVTLTNSPTLTPTNGANGRLCVVECLASGAQRVPVWASSVKLTDGITALSLTIPTGRVGVFLIRCSTITGSTVYELTSAYLRAA